MENGLNHLDDDKKISPIPEWVKNDPEWQKQQTERLESKRVGPKPPPPPKRKNVEAQSKLKDEQEIKNLHAELEIKNPESQEENEIEKLAKEFKDDLEKGKAAYKFCTKIPKGETYRGYTENDQGVEYYYRYSVCKEGNNAVKPSSGVRTDGWNWWKFGDVLAVLAPIERNQKRMETITEEKKGFFGGIKKIQTQKEITKNVPVTIADYGIKDSSDEALYSLTVEYMVDQSKFTEKRGILNIMTFSMPEKLARGLSEEITKDYKKLFKFLTSIDPELMKLAPPRENPENPNQSVGLVFYELKDNRADYRTIKPTTVVPKL